MNVGQLLEVDIWLHLAWIAVLNPAVLSIYILSFLASGSRWSDAHMQFPLITLLFSSLIVLFSTVDHYFTHGRSRKVIWDEEVIVITGGASGLGLLLAEVYGLRGCSVAVVDVDAATGTSLPLLGEGVRFFQGDVSRLSEMRRIAQEIHDELGCPSVLINNAARVQPRLVSQAPHSLPTTLGAEVEVNLQGALHTLEVFLPMILTRENGGHIVNVSSVLGIFSPVGLLGYAASKAGLSTMHQSLQAELRFLNKGATVKTSHVLLGQMDTPMFHHVETPSRFIAPIVKAKDVCTAIVKQVDAGDGGDLYLPLYAYVVRYWPLLPGTFQILLRWWSGIDEAATKGLGKVS